MLQKKIELELGQLAYVVYNPTATTTIICFHGFGQAAEAYYWLANTYKNYRIISIDLFFHGSSTLLKPKALKQNEWKLFFDQVIKNERLTTFSLAGYSMGGRFALTTLTLYPQMVESIYLIAADGIKASRLFKIATRTAFMRGVFQWMLNSYPAFILISNALTKTGILNKGLQKFAQLHMKEKSERARIYNSWTSFRNLALAPKEIGVLSDKYQIPVHITLGKFDRVIPVSRIKPYLVENELLNYKTVEITHHKLFYYDFLNQV